MYHSMLKIALTVVVSFHASALLAQNPKLLTGRTVYYVGADASRFGGCFLAMNYPMANDTDLSPYCSYNMVSLGCDGQRGHSKSSGTAMFGQAQLAFVAGKTINVRVDPSQVVDSVCVATRVDVN